MTKVTTRRLWMEVPAHERVTEDFLRQCAGAATPGWVKRQLWRQQNIGCHAAVRFAPWTTNCGLWQPCGKTSAPGEQFCAQHGGLTLARLNLTAEAYWKRKDMVVSEMPMSNWVM
jgi:hypothetical protein